MNTAFPPDELLSLMWHVCCLALATFDCRRLRGKHIVIYTSHHRRAGTGTGAEADFGGLEECCSCSNYAKRSRNLRLALAFHFRLNNAHGYHPPPPSANSLPPLLTLSMWPPFVEQLVPLVSGCGYALSLSLSLTVAFCCCFSLLRLLLYCLFLPLVFAVSVCILFSCWWLHLTCCSCF